MTAIANNDFITAAQGGAGLKFTPTTGLYSPATSFGFNVQSSLTATAGGLGGSVVPAGITVNAAVTTPAVSNATTSENTQTTSGLVLTPNANDGTAAAYFQISNISGGTLYLNNGVTALSNGQFITAAQGQAGLKFSPATGLYSPGTSFGFNVQASLTATAAGLGGSVVPASVTVTAAATTPSVTNAVTKENTQTTSGLVLTPNPNDGTAAAFFQITNITGGTLYQNDGMTAIANNAFITVAQGTAGLKFTPTTNLYSPVTSFSFGAQASTTSAVGGLGGNVVTATITVSPVPHAPSVTNASTTENTQTSSGLVLTPNVLDGTTVGYFQISGITGGTLYLNNGVTGISNGDFITAAQGAAGLKFTPATGLYSPGTSFGFNVQASLTATAAGLGGSLVPASITVNAAVTTPSVSNATTSENTQTVSGLVLTPNPNDGTAAAFFQITNITGGTLYQNDGTTAIVNNGFITVAQGEAGLKFTPTTGLYSPATSFGFNVQSSLTATAGGLGGSGYRPALP